jgi:hypothetical protein
MKRPSKRTLIVVFLITILIGLRVYHTHYFDQPPAAAMPPPQDLVAKQLAASALSPQSVWDQAFLAQDTIVREKIADFETGKLCKNLKELDTKNLTHQQISDALAKVGFTCVVRPLTIAPTGQPLDYLKIDNSITQNPKDKGVAHQEICQDRRQPECVIRIKRDGFPLNRRSAPHSSKAVLVDRNGDPGSYNNEAFKISAQGQSLPKGPSAEFGSRWVGVIMEEAHPALKEPQRTGTS